MTAITATPSVPARPRPARARDVLASEWIKLRSVRSTYLTLLFAAWVTRYPTPPTGPL